MQRDRLLPVHARVHQLHAAVHARKAVAEHHAREVQRVDAHVQQRAARQLRTPDALDLLDGVEQACAEHPRLADGAAVDEPAQDLPGGHVARPDRLGDEHALLPAQRNRLLRLRGVGGERLLAQDVPAVRDGELHVFEVVGVRRGDVHQRDGGIGEHLLIGAVGAGKALLPGEGLCAGEVARGDGIQGDRLAAIAHAAQRGGHGPGDRARAEDGNMGHEGHLLGMDDTLSITGFARGFKAA